LLFFSENWRSFTGLLALARPPPLWKLFCRLGHFFFSFPCHQSVKSGLGILAKLVISDPVTKMLVTKFWNFFSHPSFRINGFYSSEGDNKKSKFKSKKFCTIGSKLNILEKPPQASIFFYRRWLKVTAFYVARPPTWPLTTCWTSCRSTRSNF